MPRLPEVTPESADPAIAKMLQAQEEAFGHAFNATKMMGHCPEIVRGANGLGAAIDKQGNVEPALRYLLYVRVAQLNGCPF
ncbi:MAG: carboxymuconolactone decarboxylase family protein [Chromatiales bacterium]|jgi:hypothetical protein|nr:carboxymuconolactone decarboxylase family protein [Chromatiales bacterium]